MMDDKLFNKLKQSCEEAIAYAEQESPCAAGCLFNEGVLVGDCRAPASKDCALNKRVRDRSDVSLEE